ncbi:MAG: hypothetical protein IKM12_06520 [Alistipes sp.]|nr:hypothetical protein [Alistipes sp.]
MLIFRKIFKRNILLIFFIAGILACLIIRPSREWIFYDLEHALVFISVVFPIINLLVTRDLKIVDLRHDYLKSIHEERVNSYPKLHILTDGLGTLSRSECVSVSDLELYLKKIADWDANYAVFAGAQTTNNLFVIRRKLEEYIEHGKDCEGNECKDLLYMLEKLEYYMKSELGVLYESDLKDEPKLDHAKYGMEIHSNI